MCEGCENRLSDWEGAFRNQVFAPANRPDFRAGSLEYGDWCLKFATSLSWRVLHGLRESEPGVYSDSEIERADAAAEAWRSFMLDSAPHPGEHTQHIFHTDIVNAPYGNASPYLNRYLLRSIDAEYLVCDRLSATYAKLGRLIILGIVSGGSDRLWRSSKIRLRKGRIMTFSDFPAELRGFLNTRANLAAMSHRDLSPTQRQVIDKMFSDVGDAAIASSESMRAFEADLKNAGDEAYRITGRDPHGLA